MHFKQFYLGCLAHASYFIGNDGEAAVVDPQRDVQLYLDEAEAQGMRIHYVIETHLHADFVSGHRELAEKTGAEIVFGAAANAEVPHRAVREGDELRVGGVVLRAMETPGHTPEGISWLVIDGGSVRKVLTGDTLFIGDVGRPDLAGGRGYTSEQMAAMLYDSLHGKILALDDAVEVWPAHGAGSACGKNISRERSSTIGLQRRTNYALQPMPREAFVRMMTADLPPAPRYFPMDAEINRRGARPLDDVRARPLTADAFRDAIHRGAIPLDARGAATFGAGHVPGAINIGLDGQYASWAGTLLSADTPIVLVADPGKIEEAVMRLARVGMENVSGFLNDGMAAWDGPVARLPQMDVSELRDRLGELRVLDVRRPGEYESGYVPGARNVTLAELPERLGEVERGAPLAVICQSGYRSSIGASLLLRQAFDVVGNVAGGTAAWMAAGYALTR